MLGKKVGNYYLESDDIISYITYRYKYVDYLVFYGRHSDALKEMLRLGKYFDDDSPIIDLKTYHRRLYEIYSLMGDYKNALVHCEKFNRYKSEQLNENTINSIKNTEVERTRMIEELKRDNAEKLHAARNTPAAYGRAEENLECCLRRVARPSQQPNRRCGDYGSEDLSW